MSEATKYDDVLASMLVDRKSILGFLSTIFNFLARRTDFYYVPAGQYENMGFPKGVAEELVVKVLRNCDPKSWKMPESAPDIDLNHDIMCSTVAQEVEIIAEEDAQTEPETSDQTQETAPSMEPETKLNKALEEMKLQTSHVKQQQDIPKPVAPDTYKPPHIPVQKNSEAYNGAVRDQYSWSQSIGELEVTVKLPLDIKSSKELRVSITALELCAQCAADGQLIVKDTFSYKIKPLETVWTVSEGRLMIHLEKQQERWWNALLSAEPPIDLSHIDCSRPLDELPEEHIAKVRELQWNQERRLRGEPTSDELRNLQILKKAWNMDQSPFKGKEFDPSVLQ